MGRTSPPTISPKPSVGSVSAKKKKNQFFRFLCNRIVLVSLSSIIDSAHKILFLTHQNQLFVLFSIKSYSFGLGPSYWYVFLYLQGTFILSLTNSTSLISITFQLIFLILVKKCRWGELAIRWGELAHLKFSSIIYLKSEF